MCAPSFAFAVHALTHGSVAVPRRTASSVARTMSGPSPAIVTEWRDPAIQGASERFPFKPAASHTRGGFDPTGCVGSDAMAVGSFVSSPSTRHRPGKIGAAPRQLRSIASSTVQNTEVDRFAPYGCPTQLGAPKRTDHVFLD